MNNAYNESRASRRCAECGAAAPLLHGLCLNCERRAAFLIDLGPCCACGRIGHSPVRNILLLDVQGLEPGRGWGCSVCNLPADGAIAIVCDDCRDQVRLHLDDESANPCDKLATFCTGPDCRGRAPLRELAGRPAWVHNPLRHAMEARDVRLQ